MLKSNVNYIDAATFENIILTDSRVQVTVQKGFVKVSGKTGRNVYISKTKFVGRVDLSGLDLIDHPAVRQLGEDEIFGNVTQQLDFTKSKDEILEAFALVMDVLATAPAVEKKLCQIKKANGEIVEAQGWTVLK